MLEHVSERLKNDKDVVLEAIEQIGYALAYCTQELKDNKEIVLRAIKQDGWILNFASQRLQNDKGMLEILESTKNLSQNIDGKKWYAERMEVLNGIRNQEDKEFIQDNINKSNKKDKKNKF